MIQSITPENESAWLAMRKKDVTSTEVAALFGCSPYVSHYELWHRKKGMLDCEFEVGERMKWGTRLQDSIANGVAEDKGWKIRRMTEYLRDPSISMGASFDFEIDLGDTGPTKRGILEVKNVDAIMFRDGWIVDGDNIEAPPHIELQVQQQLALTGYSVAYIAALVGGNRVVLIERTPDARVIEEIRKRILAFWVSITANRPPAPDYKKDAAAIAELYSYAEPGKVLEMTDRIFGLCAEYKSFKETARIADDEAQAKKAELLTLIGDAERVVGDRFSISARMIGPTHIEYDREAYRDFRITVKKLKGVPA